MRRLTHDVHIVTGHRGTVVRLWAEVPAARDASSRGELSETSVVDANQRSWAVPDKPVRSSE